MKTAKLQLCIEVEGSGTELVGELKAVLGALLHDKAFFTRLAFKREAGVSMKITDKLEDGGSLLPYASVTAKIKKEEK